MSPNEFELRAALHDGEGTVPDADLVIARALRVRYKRRRTITSVVSAAAVVAVIAVGGTLLARSGSDESGAGGGGAVAGVEAPRGANGQPPVAQRSAGNTYGSSTESIACPLHFPRLALPGGGGTDQFGADGPLFAEPVVAMTVCLYSPSGTASVKVSSGDARRLAAELETAPVTAAGPQCLSDVPSLAMYASDPSGTVLPVVTGAPGCRVYHLTNGTATRVVHLTSFAVLHLTNSASSPNQGSPVK